MIMSETREQLEAQQNSRVATAALVALAVSRITAPKNVPFGEYLNQLEGLIPAIIQELGPALATISVQQHTTLRGLAGLVPNAYQASLFAPDVYRDTLPMGFIAQPFYRENDREKSLERARRIAAQEALAQSRTTAIRNAERDPDSNGWKRITRHNACAFCRFLANRGAVYSRDTVRFAAHEDCRCAAVPSFDKDAREQETSQYVQSDRYGKHSEADQERLKAAIREFDNDI